MGSTYVTLTRDAPPGNYPGFWMRDEMLELWLRLLALHLPEPRNDGKHKATTEIRNRWLLASCGAFIGCVPHGMEDACATQEGRAIVRYAIDSLLYTLRQTTTPLDASLLELINLGGLKPASIERKWLLDIGQAFLDLLDGKIKCTVMDADNMVMPGTLPYESHLSAG